MHSEFHRLRPLNHLNPPQIQALLPPCSLCFSPPTQLALCNLSPSSPESSISVTFASVSRPVPTQPPSYRLWHSSVSVSDSSLSLYLFFLLPGLFSLVFVQPTRKSRSLRRSAHFVINPCITKQHVIYPRPYKKDSVEPTRRKGKTLLLEGDQAILCRRERPKQPCARTDFGFRLV